MGQAWDTLLLCAPILLAFGLSLVGIIAFFKNKIGQGIGFLLSAVVVVVVGLCLWMSMIASTVPLE